MVEDFKGFKRSKFCGEISSEDLDKEVRLCGWVHHIRDHGGVIFIDLRDREGIVQIVVEEKQAKELYEKASHLKPEWVVGVAGRVRKRPEGTENPKLKTGYYEVVAEDIKVFSVSEVPPFPVDEETPVSEDLKLRFRFLDLRREGMKENIIFRHRVYQVVRNFLSEQGFIEVETPFLTKSTPEGARDFVVPSRLHPGRFYALPQSPQLFKQILMVAGFDRYFQIVKCFRDEDLRKDRQPEFTQIDLEMSFVTEEDVMNLSEMLIAKLFKETLGMELGIPFERISYKEAMDRFGSDKPDRRFGLELIDLTEVFKNSDFKVFRKAVEKGGAVKAIRLREAQPSRKDIDELTDFVKGLGAPGLAWIRVEERKLTSPIVKFLKEEEISQILKKTDARAGDTLFFSADSWEKACTILGHLRVHIAEKFGVPKTKEWDFLWVVDFPLLEWDEDEKRLVSLHHPFTSPKEEDIEILQKTLEKEGKVPIQTALGIKARAYDLVINGEEVGGGSIRIHRKDVQELIFELIGIAKEEAQEKFGFLLNALKYGAPPHGGIAFGLDRLVAIMRGLESIRDVIAFPKTQKGICPLTLAPSELEERQLKEVHIKVVE